MLFNSFSFKAEDGIDVFVYNWNPDNGVKVKGVVQIAHGMAETAARYERFAEILTGNGYVVYANDHRGHGKTAGNLENLGYLAEKDGLEYLVKDMHQLSTIILNDHPTLPIFLFGHSMGSFASQRYIMLYGDELKGVILSGSNGSQALLHKIGFFVSKREVKKYGRKAKSDKMNQLSFGSYNKHFNPNRTEFDWLSRDNDEVDKYITDPYCGSVFTAGFFYDFMKLFKIIDKEKNMELVPNNLPIYLFAGDKDPVGNYGKGVIKLFNAYRKHGIKDITMKLYSDGRHESLNEINREEVMADVVKWLDKNLQ
ncbi:alpha/beta hydrolase [Konateibacter massiliensis]|uniref:alpha/beta hydrolase n=1 Tax=Konateibacter massiliensis TaxID=2002841 RepID=UPI000C153580|nr:alpha/beta hydrolase [Konateibacter massiliensis]